MGQNQQSTSQSQQQTSNPWAPTQPALTNLLGAISNTNTNVTAPEHAGLQTYMAGVGQIPGFLSGGAPTINNLLNGTTANNAISIYDTGYNDIANTLNSSVGQLGNELSPYFAADYTNPFNTPGFSTALNQVNSNITNQVNGMFAGAGRSGAGSAGSSNAANASNPNFLSYSLAGAEAPIISNEFNTLTANQLGAANMLSSAQQGAANSIESANQAAAAANLQAPSLALQSGLVALGQYPGLYQAPYQAAVTAYANPYQNFQYPLSEIQPIAGLGGQISGTGNSTTTQPVNPWTTGLGAGLGAAALAPSFFPSDERLKENIEPVGLLNNGLNIYRYNFKGDPRPQIGVLAQEVEQVNPEAVVDVPIGMWGGSVKMVDYNAATQPDDNVGLWRRAA